MLCGLQKISRVYFYKWLRSVPLKYRKLLRDYMQGIVPDNYSLAPVPPSENGEGFFIDREPEVYQ